MCVYKKCKIIIWFLLALAQALSFTKLPAGELGQRLLQWGAADWGQGHVTSARVQKSKKNKGKKRHQWIAEVKAFHAGRGKGSSKGFPEAPWWKPPTEEAEKKQDQEEEEDDVQLVEPLVKKSKKDDDDEDDSFETTRSKRFCVFGP